MISKPMDVLEQFSVRKSAAQKKAFREQAKAYFEKLGYAVKVEKGNFGAQNVIIGDPTQAKYLITAHYDTPAGMFWPNFITPFNIFIYLAYQLLVVCMVLAVALAVGIPVAMLTQNDRMGLMIGYFAYLAFFVFLMFGPANRNNANDNTSGIVTLMEIAENLPENLRSKVCFVLFDLEEAGLIGSSTYRKAHKKETEKQIILNLDCVGDGDDLIMFPTGKLKKDAAAMAAIDKIGKTDGKKSLQLHKKGLAICPSDHKNFPKGVGIMAFNRWNGTLYCDKIHTKKDTKLDTENVTFIRDALLAFLADAE